jgi:hypothetical protein
MKLLYTQHPFAAALRHVIHIYLALLHCGVYSNYFKDFITYEFCITTNFIDLSPSSEAANCVAAQEISQHFMEPEDQYRIDKSPPLVPLLSQIYLVRTTPIYRS